MKKAKRKTAKPKAEPPKAPSPPPESDARKQIEELWQLWKALQTDHERGGYTGHSHELHSWMCFLAGATGIAFRMRDIWVATGRDTLREFVEASREIQPLLTGLMAGFQAGEVTSATRSAEAKKARDGTP